MAKNDIDPAHLERKKLKQKEIRKQQKLKQTQRLEKIKHYDVNRLQLRIKILQDKKTANEHGKLPFNEEKTLNQLQSDLNLLINYNKSQSGFLDQKQIIQETQQNETDVPQKASPIDSDKLGRKSIFYEPEWNPLGRSIASRPDLPNVIYPLHKSERVEYEPTANVDIPLPPMPQPRFYKLKQVDLNAVISKDEVSHGELTKEKIRRNFILPSHLLLQQQQQQQQQQKQTDREGDIESGVMEDFGDMAEEEEEYWKNQGSKRKYPE